MDWSDILLIAVKPQDLEPVLMEIKAGKRPIRPVISICAGVTIGHIKERLGKDCPVVRVMPNIPVKVFEGMSAIACRERDAEEAVRTTEAIFSSIGKILHVDEDKMDVITALSGSGPGYAYLMIEALADGAVAMGMKKDEALILSAQTLLGASKLLLETGEHPAKLRDLVTSPGGTTAAGLMSLEASGVRYALMKAVRDATERSKNMKK